MVIPSRNCYAPPEQSSNSSFNFVFLPYMKIKLEKSYDTTNNYITIEPISIYCRAVVEHFCQLSD